MTSKIDIKDKNSLDVHLVNKKITESTQETDNFERSSWSICLFGLIELPIIFIFLTLFGLPILIINILLLPLDIFRSIRALIYTNMIDIEMKIIIFILFPIAIVLLLVAEVLGINFPYLYIYIHNTLFAICI